MVQLSDPVLSTDDGIKITLIRVQSPVPGQRHHPLQRAQQRPGLGQLTLAGSGHVGVDQDMNLLGLIVNALQLRTVFRPQPGQLLRAPGILLLGVQQLLGHAR